MIVLDNGKHIKAEEGFVLKRISDDVLFGDEVYLGYTWYINGKLLEEPLLELPEHFTEVDKASIELEEFVEENLEEIEDYSSKDYGNSQENNTEDRVQFIIDTLKEVENLKKAVEYLIEEVERLKS